MATKNVTDENFETEVLKADKLALVDFWAEWCGPCRAIAPIVEEIAADYRGKVKVGKLNVVPPDSIIILESLILPSLNNFTASLNMRIFIKN